MPRYSDIVFAIMYADRGPVHETVLASVVALLCDLAAGYPHA